MKLELEFVHRRSVPWVACAVCLAAATACLSATIEWQSLRGQQQRALQLLESQRRELQVKQRAAASHAANADPGGPQRIKEQLSLLRSLNWDWNRVLSPIETGGDKEVALLGLSYSQSTGVTQLQVEALSAGALVRYVEYLNGDGDEVDGGGQQWYLANYQAQPQNNPPTVKGLILKPR